MPELPKPRQSRLEELENLAKELAKAFENVPQETGMKWVEEATKAARRKANDP